MSKRSTRSRRRSTGWIGGVTATSWSASSRPVIARPSNAVSPAAADSRSRRSYGRCDLAPVGTVHNSRASAARPSRLHRPARCTIDGHGATSVINNSEVTSTPASKTWVATTIVPLRARFG